MRMDDVGCRRLNATPTYQVIADGSVAQKLHFHDAAMTIAQIRTEPAQSLSRWCRVETEEIENGFATRPSARGALRQRLGLCDLDAWEDKEAFAAQFPGCIDARKSDFYARSTRRATRKTSNSCRWPRLRRPASPPTKTASLCRCRKPRSRRSTFAPAPCLAQVCIVDTEPSSLTRFRHC